MMNVGPAFFTGAGASGGADPFFANVVLLLHFDGANGSTTITDSSSFAKTVTAFGTGAISTSQSMAGGSAYLGGTAGYLGCSLGADGSMTGDFCVELFARDGGNDAVLCAAAGALLYNDSFDSYGGASLAITTNSSTGTWHHLAITRSGSTMRAFYDGALMSSATYSGTVDLSSLEFGRFTPNNNLKWTGFFDEIRVTKGQARYTAGFTVPAVPFPNS